MKPNTAWMLAFFLAVLVGVSAAAAETTRDGDLGGVYFLGPLWLTMVAFAWSSNRRS